MPTENKEERRPCRVIRVDRTAIHELINEFFMEHMETLFGVADATEHTIETKWNPEDDSFTAVLFEAAEGAAGFVTDLERIEQTVGFTASGVFQRPAYQEFDLEEFRK